MKDTDSPTAPVSALTESISCISCGYDLRGLPSDSQCPECAEPIENSLKPNLLRFADPERLTLIARGARRIGIGLVLYGLFIGMAFVGSWIGAFSAVSLVWKGLILATMAVGVAMVLSVWDFTAPCRGLRESPALVRWRIGSRIVCTTTVSVLTFNQLARLSAFGEVGAAIYGSTPIIVLQIITVQLLWPLDYYLLALYGATLCERMDEHEAAARLRLLGFACFLASSFFAGNFTIAWLQYFGIPMPHPSSLIGDAAWNAIGVVAGITAVLLTPVAIIAFLRIARKLRAAADAGADDQPAVSI